METYCLTVGELPYIQPTAYSSTEYLSGGFGTLRSRTPSPWANGMCSITSTSRVLTGDTGNTDNVVDIAVNANHAHTITVNGFGSNYPHNNIPPYKSCYIWLRTA